MSQSRVKTAMPLSQNIKAYQQARRSKDARYDGTFFVAVKTTKIYCRPICPAPMPKEENVEYHPSAISAQQAGFRPCRRCRPESAPQSAAWIGTQAVLNRAIRKIQAGDLNNTSLEDFSEKLGVSGRYLRKLFQKHLGTTPTNYATHVRLMFSKQLLHQTQLSITDIAYSSGFNSIRRFNDAFKKHLKLTPSEIRKSSICDNNKINILLNYRGAYNWPLMKKFLKQREITLFETVGDDFYERSFLYGNTQGSFKAQHLADKNAFSVSIELNDMTKLMPVVAQIRKVLDIDANIEVIEQQLASDQQFKKIMQKGLRLPATWDSFEAGIKAILGQQVSVKAAYTHCKTLIEKVADDHCSRYKLFPSPQQVAEADLSFLKMPQSRKQTLKNFADWYCQYQGENIDTILELKGIGPWTLEYIKLRSGSNTDAFPAKDLGVLKALKQHQLTHSEQWSPWRSYATLHLWNALSNDE